MPGIQAGEIGPKVHSAMGSLDNGWARFDHVRIPRSHMLSRFAQVTEEGQYVRPPHDKLSYGGMIFIRAQMIGSLSWRLAKGRLNPLSSVWNCETDCVSSRFVNSGYDLPSIPSHATSIRRPRPQARRARIR